MRSPLLLVLLFYFGFTATGQTIIGRQLADQYPIGGNSKTYGLTWLPADYKTTNTYYPLIIFLHAAGEVGDGIQGLSKLLNVGLPRKIAEGWDPQAINPADGKNYKFIVVTPQAPTSSGWSYSYTHVKNILPDVMSRYRVDAKRIYIMGISSGGGGTWSSVTNDSNFTKKFAAVLPVSSVGVNNPNIESPNIKYISGKYGVKVWTVCGTQDGLYSLASSYVNTINTATPRPTVPALLTGVPKYAHDTALWTMVFDASWRNNSINLNFYEWMLQYQRTDAVQPPPPPNLLPVANAGQDRSTTLPQDSIKLTGTGSDIDGTIASYLWTKISGPSNFAIQSPTMAETMIKTLAEGVYKFELKVTDNIGATAKDTVVITVLPAPNKPPVVNAGTDQSITLPVDSVQVSGTATDQDGTISSYSWRKISGPSQSFIATPNQAQSFLTKLVQGTYQFEFQATDNSGAVAKDTLTIIVLPAPNKPPVVNAGTDQLITLPLDSVLLSGSATDQDGTITSYLWRKISGPSSSSIIIPNQQQTVVAGLTEGIYQFEFKVADNSGGIAKDTVTVTVLPAPNKPPVADAGSDQIITLPVNNVILAGAALDPEGKIASYLWSKVDGPGQFNILSANQLQTSVDDLKEGVYKFELTVTDDHNDSDADTVTVTVLPQPNQPPVVNAGDDQAIILPSDSVTLQGVAQDPDGAIAAYQWKKIAGPDSYSIASPDQPETVVSNLNAGIYQFELTATDNDDFSAADTIMVSVMAPPPNMVPVANAGNDQVIYLPVDSVILSGSGSDTDGIITGYSWKKIEGPDQFLIMQEHDAQTVITGLTEGNYQFELIVTDNDEAVSKDTVVVTVLPPNQPPVVNAGGDQFITLPIDSVLLSGGASDADGTIKTYLWTKITGPEQFSIISPGQKQAVVNGLVEGTYQFELKVTDNAGGIATDTVMVTVLPPPNQLPIANAGNDQTTILPRDSVLLSGSASDADGIITSYLWTKISGPAQSNIATANNAETVVTNLIQGAYQFELKATDNAGASAKDTLTVTVLPPPNQLPIANAGSDQTITLPRDSVLLSGSASDADGIITSYLWTKISGPAQSNIATVNNAQTAVTNLIQGTYQFELKATDNAGGTAADTLIVTVLPPPNQPPVTNAGNDQAITLPRDSVLLSGSASDADGTITSYLWTKISGPAQSNIATANNAQTVVTNLIQGAYQFELKATDNAGASAKDTLTITVLPASNQPPVANAGIDQSIILPSNTVSLSGSGTDVDGTIGSYAWTKISGPSQFNINNSNIATPVLTNLVTGTYTFRLTVTDNKGASATDDINIVVNQILAGYKLIPGKIEAEAYTSMSGIRTENAGDAGGGLDVGWIDNGDWMDFNVYVDSAGTYTVNFRVATANNGAKLQLRKSNGTVLGSLDLPNTASYQGWITKSMVVSLSQGYQTLRVISTASLVWNFNWMEFVRGVPSAKIIPAKIEAEAYDAMLGIQMEPTGDAGGGLDVGWINNNDWLDYYVNASSAGTYNVTFRIATPSTAAKLSITKPDGTVLANVNIPRTGGYQTWSTVSTSITLPQGSQTLRIISKANQDFNFNWVEFVKSSSLIAQNTESLLQAEGMQASTPGTSSFEISPNPVRDRFNLMITSANTGMVKIQVADLQGSVKKEFRQVKDLKTPLSVNLSLYGLTPGIYSLRLQIGNWSYSKLILKE